MIHLIEQAPVACLDTETTGLSWHKDRVFGFAVAIPLVELSALLADPLNAPIATSYTDVRQNPNEYMMLKDLAPKVKLLVNHNVKFDLHMLANDQVLFDPERVECTMIRASLINEHLMRYDLDFLAKLYLNRSKESDLYGELANLFGGRDTRKAQITKLWQAPPELVEKYARTDAELALRLWAWQEQEIKRQDLTQVWGLEKRLFPHVYKMERHGVRVDEERAAQQIKVLTGVIQQQQLELDKLAGFPVNPNPSGSITRLFNPVQNDLGIWVANDGTVLEVTPAGKPSISAAMLERMTHPAASVILRLRKLIKTRDTFISGHILGHAVNGRVHPNINQVKGDNTGGTGTGRLSYTGPALQQIPSRDKTIAQIVRPIFLPDEGQGWTYGDLDQHELRIFHHYVNNPVVVKSYQDNPDLDGHQIVADLTGLPRNATKSGGANAKQVNLAMVFNMGAGELAAQMGLPYEVETIVDRDGVKREIKRAGPEAQAVVDNYYRLMPGVKDIAVKARTIAKARGYVRTIFGRHIRFPDGKFTHKASGLIYQGSSADLIKLDLINVAEYLDAYCPDGNILLSIHDEQNISMPYEGSKVHMDAIRDLIQTRPGSPIKIRIPIRADFSQLSDNWWMATNSPSIHG